MSYNLCDEKWRRRLSWKALNVGVVFRGVSPLVVVCCLVVLTLIGPAQSVCAQRNLLGKDIPEPTDDLQRLPSDRKVVQQLQELTRLARAGDLAKIRDTLQLLQAAEPSLMIADGKTTFRPLHRDLIERIQGFPVELQSALLKQPGATPQALQIAWEDGGPLALVAFLHRHSGSTESFRAHLLLAAIHRDRGHRQATLYWLAPVLLPSAPSDLQRIAIAMRDELNASIAIGSIKSGESGLDGKPVPEDEAEAGSGDTSTNPLNPDVPSAKVNDARADSSRLTVDTPPVSAALNSVSAEQSSAASSVLPHSPAWQRMLHLISTQRNASQDLVRLLAEEGEHQAIAWMAGEPDVDSQAIYVRSSGGLLAIERKTGKVLWTRLLDRLHDQRRLNEPRMGFSDDIDVPPQNAVQLQSSREILELHRDEVTSGMTSDASRLFVLCDTGESAGPSADFSQPFGMLPRRGDMVSRSMRELVAIEKATGRRLWSAGGAPLEARFRNELSRAWFAGPPTVSGGMLFGVVERDDAHWLVCLRSETGEVVWKLMFAYPETNISQDPNRQLTASRPLVAEGMIWTSTNDGWLIAADRLTRSVVWTRRMLQTPKETEIPLQLRIRNFRNPMQQTQVKPFRETWRPGALLLLADSLVIQGAESHQLVQGAESHQLVKVDPLTGKVLLRVSPETATVILAVDDQFIVVAGPKKIQRLRLDDFKVDWATTLAATNVVPTGPGTRMDEHLLIPLSDGSIQIVRYSDGQLTEKTPALRPAFSAGGLKSMDGDLVSYGPDHVSLFSNSGTAPPLQPETIDHARFLIETGQFTDAEKILVESTPTSEETDSVHRLLFRIATARTLNDPTHRDDHLKNAARYAATSQDSAIVQFLTLETQPEITSDVVVDFLKAAPAVLNAELPESTLLKKQLLSPMADDPIGHRTFSAETHFTTTRPLRDLLLQIFEQHLADPDMSKSASWLTALKQLSDDDLLSMKLDTAILALQDELLSRADAALQAGRLSESTWHLLLQARHCENRIRGAKSDAAALRQAPDVFDARFAALVDRFRNQLAVETARVDLPLRPHPAALNLLDVVRAEMLPTAEKSPTPLESVAQQWSAWKDQRYSVLPVNPISATTMPQPNERTLLPRYREDRFLSAWRWSTYREPSVLAVRSLIKPDEPMCTIDGGMFDALSLGSSGSVMRFGSVVLVQNSMGLSAVSLIDQRVLWNRRIPNQSSNVMWQMMAEMQLFDNFSTSSIAWHQVFGRDLRICGGNDRWICVQSPSHIEVIDLLTGRNLWSLHTEPGNHYVFATESCVFLSHLPTGLPGDDPKSVTCFNRMDGRQREPRISFSGLWQTILATGDELVIFEPSRSKSALASLNWVNSVTGETRHSLNLTDMINCQFMDARTLVSVTSKGKFEIIDLLTAEKQVVQFSADANYDAEAEKGTTPEHLTKVLIMADATNYYVLPFPDQQAVQAQMMLGSMGDLQLYPIKKELRAIERATGKIRWVWDAEENTAAWFEPTADPVLLLVGVSARANKANALRPPAIPGLVMPNDRRTTITALSRISGTKLFDYTVSSRFPVPGLEFKITPRQHLDLQAFGNRVRFIPEPAPTAVP